MAGPSSFWGSLGGLASGYYEGQDQANLRALNALKLKQQKEQDAQEEKVRANMGAGLDALSQLPTPPPQQPQSPAPGQASMPQQPPPRPPQPPPQGMMPPPPGAGSGPAGMGGPFSGPAPKMGAPGGLPPYQAPQAAQQAPQAPQQGIPPPPQQQGPQGQQQPDLRTLLTMIRKKNPELDAETTFRIAQRFEPMLSQEGKMQLQMANSQIAALKATEANRIAQEKIDELAKYRGTNAPPGQAPAGTLMAKNAATTGELGARENLEEVRARKALTSGAGGAKAGKPKVFQGADGKMYSMVLAGDGQIITRDASGKIVEGTVQSAGPAGQQMMRSTVKLDIAEVDKSLENMRKNTGDTASPFFMDHESKGWKTRWTENKLTPQEMQAYDVYANRIGVSIASIQSMGRGLVSDTKVREAKRLVPVPGDEPETIKKKLDYIKYIRDAANGIIGGKQVEDIESMAKGGVPFKTEAEAEAAARAGILHSGDKVIVGGQSGTWH